MRFHTFLVLVSALTLITLISVNGSEIDYETITGQKILARNEQVLIQPLIDYKNELEQLISSVKNYTTSFNLSVLNRLKKISVHPLSQDVSILDADKLAEEISKNPLMILQLVQRLVNLLPLIEQQSRQHKTAEMNLRRFLTRPGPILKVKGANLNEKLRFLMYSIVIYGLQPDDLEHGHILNMETKSGLNEEHFYEMGSYAYKSDLFTIAINYFGHAKHILMKKEVEGKPFNENLKVVVNYRLDEAIKKHNEHLDNPNSKETFLFVEKVDNSTDPIIAKGRISKDYPEMLREYAELCRGNSARQLKTDSGSRMKAPLKCFLSSKSNLYWLLSPLKIEVHSRSPLVFQYYDILTDSQLDIMKTQSGPLLERSLVVTYGGDTKKEASRISASAVVTDEHKLNLALKVQLITGLKALEETDAEFLQVTNYATGGHFVPHWDPFQSSPNINDSALVDDMSRRGDRIATFMFYLNQVDRGGRTGFPTIGITIEPVKGSALFWYNLHPDGTVDRRTMHGGCSVLMGTKWMSTKWIRSHSQMFIQKCDPKRSDNWFYDSYGLEN